MESCRSGRCGYVGNCVFLQLSTYPQRSVGAVTLLTKFKQKSVSKSLTHSAVGGESAGAEAFNRFIQLKADNSL